ncbi:hypothetical protein JMJ77_0005739 [Colletotrichum scovillei]|uniref:Uncharacterized protein n=1 Tax=Colletotrichum scovillei TaxID=1209932 RepID=A0A9P7UJ06_9PEZI|nr:hypothetical protein JMJ77_0005739 [Colletotrichum scovillei]KAG7076942.1 hypothetical protein JMJ76_0014198 [Colletotrichum scovillei]KAG7084112.1 hypothetical protein JMJ78_0009552 [Colletotrichum scovillei]
MPWDRKIGNNHRQLADFSEWTNSIRSGKGAILLPLSSFIMASLRLCFELSIMVEGLGEGHPMTSIVFLFVPA